jgi:nucleoid DNA-binding protein
MAKQNGKKEKRTITVKDLVKAVRGKVGWGLRQDFVEEIVKETIKAIFKEVLQGKRVKLGKRLALVSKEKEEYGEEIRNIGGQERVIKKVPYIVIKTSPTRFKVKEGEKLEDVKRRILQELTA